MKKLLLLFLFISSSFLALSNATVTQKDWRWRKDDGSETEATWAADEDEATNRAICKTNENIRLRMAFQVEPDANFPGNNSNKSVNYNLSYSTSESGPFTLMTGDASQDFILAASTDINSTDDITTKQLSTSGGSFIAGLIVDNATTSNINFSTAANTTSLTEHEWVLIPTDNVQATTYYFKLDGLNNYIATLPALTIIAAPTGTTEVSNVVCKGGANGQIDLTVSGGTEPFSYDWSDEATTEDRMKLEAGSYTVTITDANGCAGTATAEITEPSSGITVSVEQNITACIGSNGGSAEATVSGGTGTLAYSWSDSEETSAIATDLAPGSYTVTVTDENLCEATADVEIVEEICTEISNASSEISSNINIYPNPSSKNGMISISTPSNVSVEKVTLLDAQQRQIATVSDLKQLTVDNLEAGIYIVEVVTNKGVVMKKLLVE